VVVLRSRRRRVQRRRRGGRDDRRHLRHAEACRGGFVGRSNVLPKILTINARLRLFDDFNVGASDHGGVSGIVKVCIAFEL